MLLGPSACHSVPPVIWPQQQQQQLLLLLLLREKCSTEIGAMTGLLLALFEERVDASKAGYELAQKLKRGEGGATPREELLRIGRQRGGEDGARRLDSRIGGKMASSGERRAEAHHAHGGIEYQPQDSRLTVC